MAIKVHPKRSQTILRPKRTVSTRQQLVKVYLEIRSKKSNDYANTYVDIREFLSELKSIWNMHLGGTKTSNRELNYHGQTDSLLPWCQTRLGQEPERSREVNWGMHLSWNSWNQNQFSGNGQMCKYQKPGSILLCVKNENDHARRVRDLYPSQAWMSA